MSNTPAKMAATPPSTTLEDVLIRGDLSALTPAQRTEYYLRVCKSLGLNPLTKPFDYLTLSGKLVLYAKRDAADQLRKINDISIEIVSRESGDGLLTVHARARDRTGRTDEDFGVVAFKGGGGEFAANAWMKCVTKAKRRVTLSISGLGFLDETELPADTPAPSATIDKVQTDKLLRLAAAADANMPDYLAYLSDRYEINIAKVADIPISHFADAVAQLERKLAAIDKQEAEAQRDE